MHERGHTAWSHTRMRVSCMTGRMSSGMACIMCRFGPSSISISSACGQTTPSFFFFERPVQTVSAGAARPRTFRRDGEEIDVDCRDDLKRRQDVAGRAAQPGQLVPLEHRGLGELARPVLRPHRHPAQQVVAAWPTCAQERRMFREATPARSRAPRTDRSSRSRMPR